MMLSVEQLLERVPRDMKVRIESRAETATVTQVEEVVTVTIGEVQTQARGYAARKGALLHALILVGADVTEREEEDSLT